jgi:cytidyltransferase-like protein
MTDVLTIGTFDLTHAGHAAFLYQAAQWGDLTVGVNSDKFLTEVYGKRKPVFDQGKRMQLIGAMGYEAWLNDGPGAELIRMWHFERRGPEPGLIAISSDWLYPKDYLKQIDFTIDEMQAKNLSLLFIPHTPGISTTDLIEGVTAWQQTIEG